MTRQFITGLVASVVVYASAHFAGLPPTLSIAPCLAVFVAILAGGRLPGITGAALAGTIAMVAAAIHTGFLVLPTAPGARGPLLNIKGPSLSGGTYDLKTNNAKATLVDFWATWCGPCMAQVPVIAEVYNEYHSRGLEVVGVSLDHDKESLAPVAAQHPWPQIFDETRTGWDAPLAHAYNIQGIPAIFLVDKDGRLLMHGLRGQAIRRAVAQAITSAETGVPFSIPPGFQFAPNALILIPLATLIASMLGAAGEVLLTKPAQLAAQQLVRQTVLLDLTRMLLTIAWAPFLIVFINDALRFLPPSASFLQSVFIAFAGGLVLMTLPQALACLAFFLRNQSLLESICKFAGKLPFLTQHSSIKRVLADLLLVSNKTEEAESLYKEILAGRTMSSNRNITASHLQALERERGEESAAATGRPAAISGELARAKIVAAIVFSIIVFGTWLAMR